MRDMSTTDSFAGTILLDHLTTSLSVQPFLDREAVLERAGTIAALAAESDKMCLTAALKLGAALPDLSTLTQRFEGLSSLLIDSKTIAATTRLEGVADDIAALGTGFATERETLSALIALNHVLSLRIEEIARNIRFLVSMGSNVKVEITSINAADQRLVGFVESLKQLTEQSQKTLKAFQATQQRLIEQLHDALKAQSYFAVTHQTSLLTAAAEIQTILEALSGRREIVARVAEQIGGMTGRIGRQIGDSIVALRVGDNTRQRLEHVGQALTLATDIDGGTGPHNLGSADDERRRTLVTQIVQIQARQLDSIAGDFPAKIHTIDALLRAISEACRSLLDVSDELVASSTRDARNYVVELERKLAFARDLIDRSSHSRRIVDETAELVVEGVGELDEFAKQVASMAIDMTIIGTNAIVTAHRFGSRGAALSVIAQHLRSHALLVDDEVARIKPILTDVLKSGKRFASGRRMQNASSMGEMAIGITEALIAFKAADAAVSASAQGCAST